MDYQVTGGFDSKYFYWNSPATFESVAITSAVLGTCAGIGITNAIAGTWGYPQLWLYITFYSCFHLGEFVITAHYNKQRVSMASFLLANGWEYLFATAASLIEAVLTHYFAPQRHVINHWTLVGFILTVSGLFIRSEAMMEAAQSFNHRVQYEKSDDHTLVTSGIYGKMRHPSYCGYYMWTVGTQLLLCNIGCIFAFSTILWWFFKNRIVREEDALVRFFGESYVIYRSKVWSGLPFI